MNEEEFSKLPLHEQAELAMARGVQVLEKSEPTNALPALTLF